MSAGTLAGIAVPAGLAVVAAGYALGYVHGQQDALGCVWNLRSVAQCLDPPETHQQGTGRPVVWSRWVWKAGPHAGQPVGAVRRGQRGEQQMGVGSSGHALFYNRLRGVPLVGALGEHLARATTMDIAHGGWSYPRGDPRR
jgi:hypothetical protein